MDERKIFEIIAPIKGSEIWNQWHLAVGGWEITCGSKEEAERKEKQLLIEECKRVGITGGGHDTHNKDGD